MKLIAIISNNSEKVKFGKKMIYGLVKEAFSLSLVFFSVAIIAIAAGKPSSYIKSRSAFEYVGSTIAESNAAVTATSPAPAPTADPLPPNPI